MRPARQRVNGGLSSDAPPGAYPRAMQPVPDLVALARERARVAGFGLSSGDDVGRLLAVLAAAVPAHGRILELGTGTGCGLAWIAHGVGDRRDVEVVSVERDPASHRAAAGLPWPAHVTLRSGDALDAVADPQGFDLIFADAEGGKTEGIERTIAALRPGGVLVMDDMSPVPGDEEHERLQPLIEAAGAAVMRHPDLVAHHLEWATGVIVAARRPPAG
jgi:predicted O-methyltransferase YrrM